MSISDLQPLALALSAASTIVGIACYIWYAAALSKVFPKLGIPGWKGWVPVLNEIEILVRGGVPGWSVIFYVIPIAQLYGLYLKATALIRVNEVFGRGVGSTILGLILPPVWATLLAASRLPADGDYDRRLDALMASSPTAGQVPGPDALGAPTDVVQPPAPQVPASSAFEAASFEAPALEAVVPEAAAVESVTPDAADSGLEIAEQVPVRFEPVVVASPWAPRTTLATTPVDHPAAPAPAIPTPLLVPPAPASVVLAPTATVPVTVPPPILLLDEATASAPLVGGVVPDEDDEDDEFDRTIVVDRRPVVPWKLIADDGFVAALGSPQVVLGRKPSSESLDVQAIAVPDNSKTLSKTHARLELSDEGFWTVHDLDSTNGVVVIGSDGAETLLPRGGSAAVHERFVLGNTSLRLSFNEGVVK